jgi:hypothetical protein
MSETLERAVGDALSVVDLAGHCSALAALVSPSAYVSLNVATSTKDAYLGIYPSGMSAPDYHHFRGETWQQALDSAYVWARDYGAVHRATVIRTMALAIIDLTDEYGTCSAGLLAGRKFAHADITSFAKAACARASEMTGNTPFVVQGIIP